MGPDIRVPSFAGARLFVSRLPLAANGNTRTPISPFFNQDFASTTDDMFTVLFEEIEAKRIGTVTGIYCDEGVRTQPSGARSYRGQNRAFDLNGFHFDNGVNWTASSFPQSPAFYLGVEAIIRQFFGTVLTWSYDPANHERIYFDGGRRPGFLPEAKNRVAFVQNCCFHLFDFAVLADGVYGPETRYVTDRLRKELSIGPLSDTVNWLRFLNIAASAGFERANKTDTAQEQFNLELGT